MKLKGLGAAVTLRRGILRAFQTTSRGAVAYVSTLLVLATAEPTPASLMLGASVSMLGECFRIWTMGYGYQIGGFAVGGPYRYVRHPFFLGTVLLHMGLALAGRSPYSMALVMTAMTFAFRLDVRRDEMRLEKHLGPRFAEYRSQVPAFLPQLLPVAPELGDNHKFSLDYALFRGHHRELNAVLGLVGAYGLLTALYLWMPKDLFHLVVLIVGMVYLVGRGFYFGILRKMRRSMAI